MNEIQIHTLTQEPAPSLEELTPGTQVLCLVMKQEAEVVGSSKLVEGRVELKYKNRGPYHAAPRNLRRLED